MNRNGPGALRFVASILGTLSFALGAAASPIPPDDMFFPPLELVADVYPSQPLSGDGITTPWEAVWTVADIAVVDPGRYDYAITGVQILPVLVPNPSTTEGEYTDSDLAAIDVTNYPSWYFMVAGIDVFDTSIDYAADLTAGVLTASFTGPSLYAVRVNSVSRPSPLAPLEARSHVFSEFVNDFFAEDGAPDPHGPKRKVSDVGQKDLNVVSTNDPNDNGAMVIARATLNKLGKPVATASTIQEAIDKIRAKSDELGRPISVTLFGHGRSGSVKIGTQRINKANDSVMTPADFGAAVRGKVASVTTFGCKTGEGAAGQAYLQNLANGANVQCSAWPVTLTCAGNKRIFGINVRDGYFNIDAKGKKASEDPPPVAVDADSWAGIKARYQSR